MENGIIEKAIEIDTPISKVWHVFTDPEVTRRMGGYYETDWKIGNPFCFRKTDGNRLTNGVLLDFQPQRLIKHNLFDPDSGTVIAVITYEFREKEGHTLLAGKEELTQPLDEAAFADASAGWESALNAVKELAESL